MKLALLACSLLAVTSVGLQEVTLRLKPKKNSVYTYTTITEVASSTTGDLKLTKSFVTTSMKVISSDKNEIRLLTTIEDIKSDARGAADAKAMKTTFIVDPVWRFKDVSVEGGGASGQVLVNSLKSALRIGPIFPEKSVRPNDQWTVELDVADLFASMYDGFMKVKGEAKALMTNKLLSIEERDGRRIALLRTSFDTQFSLSLGTRELPATWKLETTSEVDLQTGMSVGQRSEQTQVVDMPEGKKLTIVTKSATTLDSLK